MPRRHVVRDLDENQFEFVINAIINGDTDREISLNFETEFGQPLAKSSLNRWRAAAGDELAERYRLARYQARQLLIDLKEEDQEKYQIVIGNIEDRLLTATREVISSDPMKLLRIRQNEEKLRLKGRELDLKGKQLELEREKAERTANLQKDRFKIAADTWQFILVWMTQHIPTAADVLTKNSQQLLEDLEEHLENQAA
jgi:hypothetical protein